MKNSDVIFLEYLCFSFIGSWLKVILLTTVSMSSKAQNAIFLTVKIVLNQELKKPQVTQDPS